MFARQVTSMVPLRLLRSTTDLAEKAGRLHSLIA
jgi:hypothetical protein